MRYLLIFLFAVSAKLCSANDTLTLGQVFNRAFGDTFYYYNVQVYYGGRHESIREIVINYNYFSSDSDSIFVTLYPALSQDYAVFHSNFDYPCADTTISIDTASQYNGRMVNIIECTGGLESIYYKYIYAEGLGLVYYISSGGNPFDGWWSYETTLVYYSKGTEKWGSRPSVGISALEQDPIISAYPSVNSGTFFFLIDNLPLSQVQFQVIDIHGRTIFTTEIQNRQTAISIKEFVPGFYMWSVTEQNKLLRTGKMIMK